MQQRVVEQIDREGVPCAPAQRACPDAVLREGADKKARHAQEMKPDQNARNSAGLSWSWVMNSNVTVEPPFATASVIVMSAMRCSQ